MCRYILHSSYILLSSIGALSKSSHFQNSLNQLSVGAPLYTLQFSLETDPTYCTVFNTDRVEYPASFHSVKILNAPVMKELFLFFIVIHVGTYNSFIFDNFWKFLFYNIHVSDQNFNNGFGKTFHVAFPNFWIWAFEFRHNIETLS